jgi:hypothetical protein
MNKARQINHMKAVFDHISSLIDLAFIQSESPADSNLIYLAGRGRRANLDGPMGTLAYAYLPNNRNYRGQLNCVFDLDEKWDDTIKFYNVMYHETLHMLGLDHDPLSNQLMSPTYDHRIAVPQLNDKSRLVKLYGKAKDQPGPTPPVTPSPIIDSIELVLNGVKRKGKITWD